MQPEEKMWFKVNTTGSISVHQDSDLYALGTLVASDNALSSVANASKKHVFKCILFNARSLRNKMAELELILEDSRFDCVIVTETWFNDLILDTLIDPERRYIIHRFDRVAGLGGKEEYD